jgi:hypothetical protein
MQSIRFDCPLCSVIVEVALDTAGGTVQCPNCGGIIRVPSPRGSAGNSQAKSTCRAAYWSFGFAVSAIFCVPAGIPAIICGHVALSRIKRSGGALKGKELAIAGLVVGYITTGLLAVAGIAVLAEVGMNL